MAGGCEPVVSEQWLVCTYAWIADVSFNGRVLQQGTTSVVPNNSQ